MSARIRALLEPPLDWSYLFEAVQGHRVMPLVYRSLQREGSEQIPESDHAKFRSAYLREGMRIHLQVLQLVELLALFETYGVDAVPFKGPVLGEIAYGAATRRKSGDLDLLIRRDDFATARDVLVDQGYIPRTASPREEQYLRYRSGSPFRATTEEKCNVDLHFTLRQRPFDGFPFSLKLAFDAVWMRCRPLEFHDTTVRTLSAEDTLLHLCANGAKDSWGVLTKICDIAELLRRETFDWPVVIQRARDSDTQRILHVGLALAHGLLEATLPAAVEQQMYRDPAVRALVTEVSDRLFDPASAARKKVGRTLPESVAHHRFRIKLLERPDEKVRYMLYRGLRKLSKSLSDM